MYTTVSSCQIKPLAEILATHLGYKTTGTFLEIGGFDGESFSNTATLADIGWTGYYIEPIREYADRAAARHARNARTSVVCCAVGATRATARLSVGRQITTGDPDFLELQKRADWSQGFHSDTYREVPQYTADEIITRIAKIPPGTLDLLVIDVEGMEEEVLKGLTLTTHLPTLVIIEIEDSHPSIDLLPPESKERVRARFARIREYFSSAGYTPVYQDHINTIQKRPDAHPGT